jgi:hypothetical protein
MNAGERESERNKKQMIYPRSFAFIRGPRFFSNPSVEANSGPCPPYPEEIPAPPG